VKQKLSYRAACTSTYNEWKRSASLKFTSRTGTHASPKLVAGAWSCQLYWRAQLQIPARMCDTYSLACEPGCRWGPWGYVIIVLEWRDLWIWNWQTYFPNKEGFDFTYRRNHKSNKCLINAQDINLVWWSPPEGIASAMKMKTHDQAHFGPYDTYTIRDQVASHTRQDKYASYGSVKNRYLYQDPEICIKNNVTLKIARSLAEG
jgi:hypothetical protein